MLSAMPIMSKDFTNVINDFTNAVEARIRFSKSIFNACYYVRISFAIHGSWKYDVITGRTICTNKWHAKKQLYDFEKCMYVNWINSITNLQNLWVQAWPKITPIILKTSFWELDGFLSIFIPMNFWFIRIYLYRMCAYHF